MTEEKERLEVVIMGTPPKRGELTDEDWEITEASIDEYWVQMGPGELCVRWQTRGAGYGLLTFVTSPGGVLRCDNEGMSRAFCKRVLSKLAEGKSWEELPELVRAHPTLDALLLAAQPEVAMKDWSAA